MSDRARQHGSILVVTMWVIIALTGLVLTLSFSMRTEAKASANRLSQAQAEAAEHGVEQLLLSLVDQEIATPGTMATVSLEARQIGDCYFWVVRPDWDNETSPGQAPLGYGMVDEGGKIDLSTSGYNMLLNLPGMTEDVADAIIDWRNPPTTAARPQGAKDDYYMSLPDPYHCKAAPYESLEELLLVKGITRDVLYGYDHNRNGVIDPQEMQSGDPAMSFNASNQGAVGFAPYVTVYGVKAGTIPAVTSSSLTSSSGTGSSSTAATGPKVNVNTVDTTRLQSVLSQNISASVASDLVRRTSQELRGGKTFASVFDYYYTMKLSFDDFQKIYPLITATPVTPAGGAGGTTGRTTGGTTGSGTTGGTTQPTATPAATTAANVGKVNINTAPPEVLACLPGQLDDSDVQAIVSHRTSLTNPTAADLNNLAWLVNIGLTQTKVEAIAPRVMGQSSVYSGDIVVVSGDGRAFRRYRVIVDGSKSPSTIISREDLTLAGWPLPPEIRDQIRAGQGPGVPVLTTGQGGSAQ